MVINATFNNSSTILWWSVLISGRSRSTWRTPPTCRRSLTNFITYCCIENTSPGAEFKPETLVIIGTDCILFSSTWQSLESQCELLPSLSFCPLTFEYSPLKPLSQMIQDLVGITYGRSSIKIALLVFFRSVNKHSRHSQFLLLDGQFPKIFSSEPAWLNEPKLGCEHIWMHTKKNAYFVLIR